MTVAKISEISSSSPDSFEDACRQGIERANRTLDNITGAWVSEMKIDCDNGTITGYRVNLKVTFVLKD